MISFSEEQWDAVRSQYSAWWAGKSPRPLAGAAIRKEGARILPPPLTQANCTDWRKTPGELIEEIEEYLSTFDYYGDAFPVYNMACFGPGVVAAMLGADVNNSTGQVWFFPPEKRKISDWHFEFDPQNKWFLRLRELYLTAGEYFKGKALLSMTDLGGALDVLSAFCPGEQLLYDLIDNPEEVKRAVQEIEEVWRKIYWEFYQAQNCEEYGCTDWSTIYSVSPSYVIQCDFCYMISTEMFQEFVADTLRRDCGELKNTLYHLDGPGELKHLEELLQIPNLKAVQWVPGAGNPECDAYPEVYRKIVKSGKLVQISSGTLSIFEKVVRAVGSPSSFHRQMIFAETKEKRTVLSAFSRLGII